MTKYHFIIPLEPVEQARPRASRTRNGVRMYDPAKVKRYKQSLALLVKSQWKYPPLTGPLKVTVSFYRAIQKGTSQKERREKLSGAIRPTKKPDLDNYVKSTLDGLNGFLWADDNMIVSIETNKYYAEQPHIELWVEKLDVKGG